MSRARGLSMHTHAHFLAMQGVFRGQSWPCRPDRTGRLMLPGFVTPAGRPHRGRLQMCRTSARPATASLLARCGGSATQATASEKSSRCTALVKDHMPSFDFSSNASCIRCCIHAWLGPYGCQTQHEHQRPWSKQNQHAQPTAKRLKRAMPTSHRFRAWASKYRHVADTVQVYTIKLEMSRR